LRIDRFAKTNLPRSVMPQPLFFEPIYQERVWGGRGLESRLGRKLPEGKRIGESWDVVDRPEAQSRVKAGEKKGKTLRELILEDPDRIMGPGYDPRRPFPILVKWLDCQERLSLQVHPPADVAEKLKGEPKTENWYLADAAPGAHLIVGLKRGVTRDEFEAALREERLEECVHRFPVREGHSILVRSGQIHAIDAGNLILEIQQNSDTTYRVYDWGRVGLDGKPRQLHVEESLSSIDFVDFEPEPASPRAGDAVLADCAEFRIRKLQMEGGREVRFPSGEEPRLLHVVAGRVNLTGDSDFWKARRGDNLLLPYGASILLTAEEAGVVLVTDRFCG
jgi:mannose-6-phosphate isomerase